MQIVSWNCRGKFREKYQYIEKLNADIYVIQECENPDKYDREFSQFFSNRVWCGENESKGLALFARPDVEIEINLWPKYCLRCFESVRVNQSFDLLAVWACSPYIEEYCIYQAINIDKFNGETVIIGDFNSNAMWDKQHGMRNHSAVVAQLKEKQIVSAYHYFSKEEHGMESQHTFCLYKHRDRPYHIDYCFTNLKNIKSYKILDDEEWLKHSDHFPIQVEIL